MAMIPCKECGQQISSTATACPHCGAVYRSIWFKIGITIAIAAGVLWVLGFVLAAIATWTMRKPIEIDLPQTSQISAFEAPASVSLRVAEHP